ncbi:hypothetical protein [Sphingobacterium multivorum]|uniref:hypothetical protein n=1 Tax=Sphingobacterium multivorum TaxID=28454 RepID=UPI0028B09DDC|nr:hypothetical protein [Sphingobacterium multivorum]
MNKENKKFKGKIMNLQMGKQVIPLATERNKGNRKGGDVMTFYGDNNLYPNFLLQLYNDSPIHKGIVNSKVDYILGDDVVYKNSDKKADHKVNKDDTIESLLRKVVKDYIIFNYYAIEVIYNAVGEPVEYNHIPANTIRTNKNKSKFWFNADWYANQNDVIEFDGWSQNSIDGGYASKIYFFNAYTPSVNNTYPIPDYSGAIKSIQTDIDIRDFHSNNINNNFSASSIITFFNGEPTPEMQNTIQNTITNSYTGTDGKKIVLNFANEDSKSAEVTNISASDWNDAFMTLKENTINDIIVGHSLTSPLLAGISISGQLGANSELETAYTIFRNLYVINKRNEIVDSINTLFKGIFNDIDILDNGKLFKKELDSTVLTQIMTIDELRNLQDLPALPNNTGNRLIKVENPTVNAVLNTPVPAIPVNNTGKFSFNEENDEKMFQSVSHIGADSDEFIVLSSFLFADEVNNTKLTNYLISNAPFAGKSLIDIQKALNNDYSIQDIKVEIAKLIVTNVIDKTNLIDESDIKKAEKEIGKSDSTTKNKIEIRYSYEGPIDDKNRPFCAKLVRANKYYTRQEVQKMSEILGFDIFKHKGGKNCRHKWVANTVVKKGENK